MRSYLRSSALAFCVAAAIGASTVSDESPECSVKFYDTTPPVACSYQKNPYLNLPEEPSMVSEGKDALSVEVPAAAAKDGYVYELTGFYQATETREYSFFISESTVATMQLGFQSRDTREFHELISTEVHSLSYEKTTTFRMEKGETYPLRFAFCSDNGILPIYISEESGETQEINTEIKQVSYEGHQQENGFDSSNKDENVSDGGESEITNSAEGFKEIESVQSGIGQEASTNVSSGSSSSEAHYYESEFYYTCYSAPKDEINDVSEETLTDVADLQVVSEGLSSEVVSESDTTRVDVPRIIEITGYCSAPADGSYTIIMPSGFIASLQIGPATTTKEQSCTVSEEWRVLDTRLYAAAEFEFSREYYYPYRMVVLANEIDYRWDITQFDSSGKEVDLLGIWNTAAESCPIASPFSARTTGGMDVLYSNDTMLDAGTTGYSNETKSDAKSQAQGVSSAETYGGFDCESFVSQRFVHTGGNGFGEEYIGTVADCSTRVGECTSVHAMTYADIEHEELGSKTWTRVEDNYEVVQKSGGARKGQAPGPGAAGRIDDEEVSAFSGVSDKNDIEDGNMQESSSYGPDLPGNISTLNGDNTTNFGNDTTLFGDKTIAEGSTDVNQTDFQAYSGDEQDSSLNDSGTLTSDEQEMTDRVSGIEDTDNSHATITSSEESETKESSGDSSDGEHGQPKNDSSGAESDDDGHGSSSSTSGHSAGSVNAGSGQRGSSGETSSSQGGSSGHGGSARQGPAGNAGRVGQDAGPSSESGHGEASNGSSNRPNGSGSGSSADQRGTQASSTANTGSEYGHKTGSETNGAPNNVSGASRGHDSPNRPASPNYTSPGKNGRTKTGTDTDSASGEKINNGDARGERTGAGKSPHDRTPQNGMPVLSSSTSDGLTQGTTVPSPGTGSHKSSGSDKFNKSENSDKPDKPVGSDESAKSDKSDTSNNTDRPSPTSQGGQVGGNGEAGKDESTGEPSRHDTESRPGHGQTGEGSPSLRGNTDKDTPRGSADGTSSGGHAAAGSGPQGQGASTRTGQSSAPGEHKAGPGDGKSGHHAGPDGKDKSECHDGNSSMSGPNFQGRICSGKNSTETSGSSNGTGPKGVPYGDDLRGSNSRGVEGSGEPTSKPEAPKTGSSPGRGSSAAISSTYDGAGAKSTSAFSFVVGLCLVLLF